ncbi:hypothetical protein UFOVP1244_12 [uncultured Caudovirales phage]|uniref:Uncharacterized protein n=1 Tax=uncultured Caudovirales phage TaxID=2100421 RepID=A0A6J5RIU1_9CAUD|nr:hypothetical protein UFOVP1244_12 [uncultured Caudovirales phage]
MIRYIIILTLSISKIPLIVLFVISYITTILTATLFAVTLGVFYKPFLLSGAITVAMWGAMAGVRMALGWAEQWEGQGLGFPLFPSIRTAGQVALFAGLLVLQPAGLGTECPKNAVCQMTLLPATESRNGQENIKKHLRQEKGRD